MNALEVRGPEPINYIAENYQLLKTRFVTATPIISFNPQFLSLPVASVM
jgi:hypothetical protein